MASSHGLVVAAGIPNWTEIFSYVEELGHRDRNGK